MATATAKKGGKKAAAKNVKKETVKKETKRGETIRLRMFKILNANPNGLTGSDVGKKLGIEGIPNILKDEGMRDKQPRIQREKVEGVRGVVYSLTAVGKQAIKDETVDSEAAPLAKGPWQKNR